ncbi:MAG: protein translocase subunit SecD [Paracoccaceae bacterium]|nr:protein translocase subunit SecD [Paracoccaceae bacterium]
MLRFSIARQLLILGLCIAGVVVALPNAFYTRVEQANDARIAMASGEGATPELVEAAGRWPSVLPSALVNLGLDLRGGAHLLAEVQVADVYAERLDGMWPGVRDALRAERSTVGTIRRRDDDGRELRVRISEPGAIDRAVAAVEALARPVSGLAGTTANDIEVRGDGADVVVTLSDAEKARTDRNTMAQSLEIIRRRVDEAGTREPSIQRQGDHRILIQVPGIGSAEDLKDLIGKTAKLTFHPVIGRTSDPNARVRSRELLLPADDEDGIYYVLEKSPTISGDHLVDAQPSFDQNNQPAVSFRLNPAGGRIFGEYTARNVGNPFAIVLDNRVISAPTIQSHIPGGSGIITGRFSVEESTKLAIQLRAGALPARVVYLEERTVGPELGQDSIDAGRIACVVAFAAILVFMVLCYGLFGLFANVALVVNVALIFGLLSVIGATLTLPGIAGIVLTIGMAVDANVLVFERIREELRNSRGPARAIEVGYERALSAIIDANITTLIAAAILFAMGSGPVRGFAVTLGLGIMTSVFTAIWLTRLMIAAWMERRRPKTIEV